MVQGSTLVRWKSPFKFVVVVVVLLLQKQFFFSIFSNGGECMGNDVLRCLGALFGLKIRFCAI